VSELLVVTLEYFLTWTTVKIWFADFTDGQVIYFWVIEWKNKRTCTHTYACNWNSKISYFFVLKIHISVYTFSIIISLEMKSVTDRRTDERRDRRTYTVNYAYKIHVLCRLLSNLLPGFEPLIYVVFFCQLCKPLTKHAVGYRTKIWCIWLKLLSAIQVQTLDRTGDSGSTPGQALLT
jgi:hypothetical protein